MKITREEFKEYIELYKNAWEDFKEYGDIINENLLDELMFPLFNWLDRKLMIDDENGGLAFNCATDGNYPIEWDTDEEGVCFNIKYTDDLDAIFDKYVP